MSSFSSSLVCALPNGHPAVPATNSFGAEAFSSFADLVKRHETAAFSLDRQAKSQADKLGRSEEDEKRRLSRLVQLLCKLSFWKRGTGSRRDSLYKVDSTRRNRYRRSKGSQGRTLPPDSPSKTVSTTTNTNSDSCLWSSWEDDEVLLLPNSSSSEDVGVLFDTPEVHFPACELGVEVTPTYKHQKSLEPSSFLRGESSQESPIETEDRDAACSVRSGGSSSSSSSRLRLQAATAAACVECASLCLDLASFHEMGPKRTLPVWMRLRERVREFLYRVWKGQEAYALEPQLEQALPTRALRHSKSNDNQLPDSSHTKTTPERLGSPPLPFIVHRPLMAKEESIEIEWPSILAPAEIMDEHLDQQEQKAFEEQQKLRPVFVPNTIDFGELNPQHWTLPFAEQLQLSVSFDANQAGGAAQLVLHNPESADLVAPSVAENLPMFEPNSTVFPPPEAATTDDSLAVSAEAGEAAQEASVPTSLLKSIPSHFFLDDEEREEQQKRPPYLGVAFAHPAANEEGGIQRTYSSFSGSTPNNNSMEEDRDKDNHQTSLVVEQLDHQSQVWHSEGMVETVQGVVGKTAFIPLGEEEVSDIESDSFNQIPRDVWAPLNEIQTCSNNNKIPENGVSPASSFEQPPSPPSSITSRPTSTFWSSPDHVLFNFSMVDDSVCQSIYSSCQTSDDEPFVKALRLASSRAQEQSFQDRNFSMSCRQVPKTLVSL